MKRLAGKVVPMVTSCRERQEDLQAGGPNLDHYFYTGPP